MNRRFQPHVSAMTAMTAAIACTLLITSCATHKKPVVDQLKVHQFEARGYPAPHEFDTRSDMDMRLIQGLPARMEWTSPVDDAAHPLLIYLPGLGQDAHAQPGLRQAWAAAGYNVLSWQPLPQDEEFVRSAMAHQQAMERLTPSLMQQRAQRLALLLDVLHAAQAKGDARLQHVDLRRIALIGFDLGAFTTQFMAGEALEGAARPATLPPFAAYVLISPYAGFELGNMDTRYQQIKRPTLIITGDNDTDGLVPAAYLRTAPFGGMPDGDKAMLILKGARHTSLGESPSPDDPQPLPPSPEEAGAEGHPEGGSMGGPPEGSGESRGPMGKSSGGRGGKGGRSGGGPGGGGLNASASPSPTLIAMQQTALAQLSTAFLDTHVNADPLARQWLSTQAPRWSKPVGDWFTK